MARHWRCIAPVAIASIMATLAGCPPMPRFLVQPLAASFTVNEPVKSFAIVHQGGGTLIWEATTMVAWLELAALDGNDFGPSVSGALNQGVDGFQARLAPQALPEGLAQGEIQVVANGGIQVIRVSASRADMALLGVSETEVDFGADGDEHVLYLSNGGGLPLTWQTALPPDAPWLEVSPTSGDIVGGGAPAPLILRANRGVLAAGTYETTLNISSNAGSASVVVRMEVPPFSLSPVVLDFGSPTNAVSLGLTVSNRGFNDLPISVAVVGGAWLSTDVANAVLPGAGSTDVIVTANPSGLAAGAYEARVIVSEAGYSLEAVARMMVTNVSVTPSVIDFGTITTDTSQTITLQNFGAQPLIWDLTVPPTAAAWLQINKSGGTLGAMASDAVLVTVSPAAVNPGAYEAVLRFDLDGVEKSVVVRMARPRPATLRVEPNQIDFGESRTEELIGIWNDGQGTVNWRIDTGAFPAWLILSPVDAGGVASGSVTGPQTDALTVRVDRDAAPVGQISFEHQFVVEASGDANTPITVTVRMRIPLVPRIVVEAEGATIDGVDFINFDVNEETVSLNIRNEGNGTLFWRIDLSDAPAWLRSVTPAQGSLDSERQQRVTVTISRDGLNYTGAQHILQIASNDPQRPAIPLLVEVLVPKKVAIAAVPSRISFGVNQTTTLIQVANFGDPDTLLNFRIAPTKDWLSVYPETGSSVGVAGDIKDWKIISVAVDRSLLDGVGASGKLVISAFDMVEGNPVPRADVPVFEVDVTVQAAELTIETPVPRLRIPSLVRFVLLMRNVRYQTIQIPDSMLPALAQQVSIFEKDVPLELSETNQFMTSGSRIRGNALILLDYSGSMQEAAQQVSDTSIAGAPDPIQALYERAISALIDEMPMNYRIGLGVFSERGQPLRMIDGADGEPLFTANKTALQERLRSIVVVDNGATALFPALTQAADILVSQDQGDLSFDDVDVKALICVTDGRLTTPPGTISDVRDYLEALRVQLFCIGWGNDVLANPLIQLTTRTGGHYYPTKTQPTGAVDAFGAPVRIPMAEELLRWCQTVSGDPCDQSIPKDFRSQLVFSYVTLNEENNVNVEGGISFNDPSDQDDLCLPEQGVITGRFAVSQLNFMDIAGDPRMGQISLKTEGIRPDGTAQVTVRADYIPRNISRLSFRISVEADPAPLMTVQQAPALEGGIIANWTRSGTPPFFTFTSTTGPLQYGDFGDLLILQFQGATGPFRVRFDVIDPVYSADPNAKYFIYPDSILVEDRPFLAPSFPSAYIGTNPAMTSDESCIVDLGTTHNHVDVSVFNLGGSHSPTGVALHWSALPDETSRYLTVTPVEGIVSSTLTPDVFRVTVDRSMAPGVYMGTVLINYELTGLGIMLPGKSLYVWFQVLGPVLQLDQTVFSFVSSPAEQPLYIGNTGQGLLQWNIDTNLFPLWLSLTRETGILGPGENEGILVRVNLSGLPAGTYEHTFTVSADNGQEQSVLVTAVQP